MTIDKVTLFIAGVVLAVVVYLSIKALQWRASRRSSFPEPKRRRDVKLREPNTPLTVPESDRLSGQTDAAVPAGATPAGDVKDEPGWSAAGGTPRPLVAWQTESPRAAAPFTPEEDDPPYADGSDYLFGTATPVLAAMLPVSTESRQQMTKVLKNAGYYSVHAWQNFAAVRYLGLILPILLFLGLLLTVPQQLEFLMVLGVVIGPILGWALPGLIVRSRAAERLRQIENGMPDMLDQLNMCVSQGMTVSSALGRVGRELAPVYPALSKELTIVNDQARVGTLPQALTSFSSRVDVPEVHSFTSLLIQTERMGTSVSEALTGYSDSMRESMRQRADEKANSATFQLLFPTVVFLMPAVFLFLAGPAVIELNRFYAEGGVDLLNATDQIRELTTIETP